MSKNKYKAFVRFLKLRNIFPTILFGLLVNFTYLLVAILNVTESQMKTCSNVISCLPKFFFFWLARMTLDWNVTFTYLFKKIWQINSLNYHPIRFYSDYLLKTLASCDQVRSTSEKLPWVIIWINELLVKTDKIFMVMIPQWKKPVVLYTVVAEAFDWKVKGRLTERTFQTLLKKI